MISYDLFHYSVTTHRKRISCGETTSRSLKLRLSSLKNELCSLKHNFWEHRTVQVGLKHGQTSDTHVGRALVDSSEK